jgi:pimeloyl-ACP methyl ester carboxylesterase|nr:alpha/beta hydrolase [Candidatus Acidoferrales bacterium]
MRNLTVCAVATVFALLSGTSVRAQDISGVWQGTLHNGTTGVDRRLVLHIQKTEPGGWSGTFYTIDLTGDPIPLASATLHGSDFEYSFGSDARYSGKLSSDGTSIKGTWFASAVLPLDFQRATKETLWRFPSPHSVSFVTVDKDVKLEVLDWGGSGPPMVFLTGLGNDAHIFDAFAPKFTATHHVYGITRRGFGKSSAPGLSISNYSADRLGDDVLAVIESLKLDRPVLVGHSIAGEELSSIGSRHPEKIAGLIYLDAGYSYAFYNRSQGDLTLDSIELRKKTEQLLTAESAQDEEQLIQEILEINLPQIEKELHARQKELEAQPILPQNQQTQPSTRPPVVLSPPVAIFEGEQKYTDIRVPILAIFAVPHDLGSGFKNDPASLAAWEAMDTAQTGAQAKAFESALPSARVVRLPHANHYVFQSNEADVLREMNAFLATLK